MWPKRSIWKTVQPGIYFLTFFALSAAVHLFLEAFRGDSELIFGGFRSAQVIAWAALAFSMWGIYRLQNRDRTAGG
jgi:prolipoprotein diacylglyceryltransferase